MQCSPISIKSSALCLQLLPVEIWIMMNQSLNRNGMSFHLFLTLALAIAPGSICQFLSLHHSGLEAYMELLVAICEPGSSVSSRLGDLPLLLLHGRKIPGWCCPPLHSSELIQPACPLIFLFCLFLWRCLACICFLIYTFYITYYKCFAFLSGVWNLNLLYHHIL